ncbi:MAG: GxxExxY protein [Bacteroidetes bacterium]|nr:GxxExxY protein [Bacteroidota bacterium]MBU1485481.1 GxxExxY protein [Bacteroidota bacterium]MBU2268799.1 GxxExxY protein [Bacteroidota bacterium]MBU2375169.1 GxxExxY protein [Bacteroidota bacterium]
MELENSLATKIIGSAINVHKELGPGLLESAYKECLFYELKKSDLFVEKEKPVPIFYDGIELECGYRMDIFVDNKVIIEVKSVKELNDIYLAQLLTYLKLSECKLGLLINFNVLLLKNGIKRVIIDY